MEAHMDGLKNGVEAKIDGIEEKLKGNMGDMKNVLKANMEGLKEGLTKLLEEMILNSKNVVVETHDENKINVKHDFIESNIGFKTHHVSKIDMRKLDGKDMIIWVLQMEQYFELHNVKQTQKVCIAILYLQSNHFVWYRWIFSRK